MNSRWKLSHLRATTEYSDLSTISIVGWLRLENGVSSSPVRAVMRACLKKLRMKQNCQTIPKARIFKLFSKINVLLCMCVYIYVQVCYVQLSVCRHMCLRVYVHCCVCTCSCICRVCGCLYGEARGQHQVHGISCCSLCAGLFWLGWLPSSRVHLFLCPQCWD